MRRSEDANEAFRQVQRTWSWRSESLSTTTAAEPTRRVPAYQVVLFERHHQAAFIERAKALVARFGQ